MKVLASDFDGTLFFEGEFHQEDIEAIEHFQSQGHLFGLCSGRPLQGALMHTQDKIQFDFYIVSSGAHIVDSQGKIVYEGCMSFDTVESLYQRYHHDYDVYFQADGMMCVFEKKAMNKDQKRILDITELKNVSVYGVSMNARTLKNARKICQEINELYKDVNAFQNKEYIDIVLKGCSKGQGIQMIKELYHEKVAGIGDSFNDLPMLEESDVSFTFVSSPDEVKLHADYVVESVCQAIHILED